jgi:hypothetical protein
VSHQDPVTFAIVVESECGVVSGTTVKLDDDPGTAPHEVPLEPPAAGENCGAWIARSTQDLGTTAARPKSVRGTVVIGTPRSVVTSSCGSGCE